MPGNNPLLPTSNNPSSRPSRLGARRISPSPATHPSISDDEDDSGLPLTTTTPIGLSEKAKGKRRATGPDQSENASPAGSRSKADKKEEQRGRSITFRFTGEEVRSDGDGEDGGDGSSGGMLSDLDVWVDAGESVGRVKDKIKSLKPALTHHPLKFIHSGRLLTDGILLLPYVRTLEERHRQAQAGGAGSLGMGGLGGMAGDMMVKGFSAVHGEEVEEEHKVEEREKEEEKVWLHCVVGAKVDKAEKTAESGEDEGDAETGSEGVDGPPTTSTQPRRRGFDALLDAGLSADEVANMRRQFYAGRGEEVPDGLDQGEFKGDGRREEESGMGAYSMNDSRLDDEHTRALEEQWIEGDLTNETAQTAAEGIYTSILTGLLVGFLYPILPWFFFREIPAPNFFEPLEVEHDRTGSSTTTTGSSGRTGEVLEEQLDWSMGILPNATGSTGSGSTGANAGSRAGGRSGVSETAPGNPGTRGLFGLRGRPGGEWVTGVVFGQRVQMAILIGTVLNIGFGAFRFLV